MPGKTPFPAAMWPRAPKQIKTQPPMSQERSDFSERKFAGTAPVLLSLGLHDDYLACTSRGPFTSKIQ